MMIAVIILSALVFLGAAAAIYLMLAFCKTFRW
jgi:hypothetical protein